MKALVHDQGQCDGAWSCGHKVMTAEKCCGDCCAKCERLTLSADYTWSNVDTSVTLSRIASKQRVTFHLSTSDNRYFVTTEVSGQEGLNSESKKEELFKIFQDYLTLSNVPLDVC